MNDLVEIEKLAKDHKPLKDTASPADLCFYWTMRSIYDCYRTKKLNTDEAKSAKNQAYAMHKQFTDSLKNALSAHAYREEATRKMCCIGSELHKAETLEQKYRRALKAISAVTGEMVTEQTEIRWLEQEETNEVIQRQSPKTENQT